MDSINPYATNKAQATEFMILSLITSLFKKEINKVTIAK